MRINSHECSYCPDPILNSIRIAFTLLASLSFIGFMIFVNVRQTKESQLFIVSKIFLNYIQMISISYSFILSYPDLFSQLLSPIRDISSPATTLFSFDCFIDDYKLFLFDKSSYLNKTLLICLLPIALWIILFLVLVIKK